MWKDWGERQDSRDTGNVTGLLEYGVLLCLFGWLEISIASGDLDRLSR